MPCDPADAVWNLPDVALAGIVRDSLQTAGLPIRAPISQVYAHRIRFAYPIYQVGFEAACNQLDDYFSQLSGLLTFGRQGLFAHDNTHHALYMAYSAVSCLDQNGPFDRERWAEFRHIFKTHVVED